MAITRQFPTYRTKLTPWQKPQVNTGTDLKNNIIRPPRFGPHTLRATLRFQNSRAPWAWAGLNVENENHAGPGEEPPRTGNANERAPAR
eukprot:869567-Lingulodinium_polyedra.AAC.1